MKRLTTEQFIERARKVHGDEYDYSNCIYTKGTEKISINCRTHGVFYILPGNFLKGGGCPVCSKKKRYESLVKTYKNLRPDLSHIITPVGSRAVAAGRDGKYFLVDEEDYEFINSHNWCLSKRGYVYNKKLGKAHRVISKCPPDLMVDHINHNTLDNRKSNLRICKGNQNQFNSRSKTGKSKYKGVHKDKSTGRWIAQIGFNRKRIYLGIFLREEDAALAYNKKAIELHGEFAYLNKID